MTVAAVVLVPGRDDAHTVVGGVAAIRRIADVAWAGGALPIVVVTRDEAEALDVGAPLSGAAGAVVVAAGTDDEWAGVTAGIAAARDEVDGTDSVLVWPGRSVHVDAETVTSLIERHGVEPETLLVPTFEGTPGWPLLLPVDAAAALASGGVRLADLAARLRGTGTRTHLIELGDPGIVYDIATPTSELPEFRGPPEPVAGSAPDWGERVPAIDPSPAPPPGAR